MRCRKNMMHSRNLPRGLSVLLTAALGWSFLTGTAQAKEKVQEFLEALRRSGMYDVAEEYLETMTTNPAVPEETKQTVPFELGKTIIDKCESIADVDTRLKELNKARGRFEEFLTKSPMHPLAHEAQTQMGLVSVSRGKALIEMSRKPSNASRKDGMVAEARTEFQKAQTVFDGIEKKYETDYAKLKEELQDKLTDADKEKKRASLDNWAVSRLQAATAIYEHSKAYDKGSDQQKNLTRQAQDKFHNLYEKYRKKAIGLFAGMFEGRCFQDLGDYKRALGIYESLLLQPDDPPIFREIKGKVLALALECWTSEDQKLYDKAADEGGKWLDAVEKSKSGDDRTQYGSGIRYFTALALDKQVEALQASNGNPNEIKKKVNALVNHATFLTRFKNEHRNAAKAFVGKYRKTQKEGEPTTFADARDASKAAIDAMSVALNFNKVAKQSNNQEMLAQVSEKENEIREARVSALKYCRLALDLRDEEATEDEINVLRYQYAFLLFDSGNYPDAAVVGEFVSRRYPKSAGAKQSALVAMEAYRALYNLTKTTDKKFEVDGLVRVAEFITATWPTDPMADNAMMLLGDIATREKDLTKAVEYFNKIPAESPRRSEADLKAGQTLWGAYATYLRLPEEDRPSKEALDTLVKQAQEILEKGIERMRSGITEAAQVTSSLMSAEVILAQIYVNAGAADKAVTMLERPDTGALAMVRAKHPTVVTGTFPEDAYKVALQSFVGAQQLDKAEAVMGELEKLVADKPDSSAQLTKIYIKLGQDLEDRVKRLQELKQLEELDKVLKGFETFLTRIKDRPEGNTFNSLNWVAETFLRLGSGLDTGDNTLSDQAKNYYDKAVATYETMLARGKSEDSFLPSPQYATGLEIRISRCRRSLGQYKQALDMLGEILKVNNKILEAQLEAAHTYQSWAAAEKKLSYYNNAIEGGRKDKTTKVPLFWGWGKLGQMVQRDPKYDSLFHETRYNLADCHFRMALLQQSPDKEKSLQSAERDIVVTYKLAPKMGGEEQYSKYNRLLKTIQAAQGKKKALGLKDLESKKPAGTESASAAPAAK